MTVEQKSCVQDVLLNIFETCNSIRDLLEIKQDDTLKEFLHLLESKWTQLSSSLSPVKQVVDRFAESLDITSKQLFEKEWFNELYGNVCTISEDGYAHAIQYEFIRVYMNRERLGITSEELDLLSKAIFDSDGIPIE